MNRVVAVARMVMWCAMLTAVSGCLFDPFGRRVRQLRAQVDSLTQRVDVLARSYPIESAGVSAIEAAITAPGGTISAASSLGSLQGTTTPSIALPLPLEPQQALGHSSTYRLPSLPFDAQKAFAKLARGLINILTGWAEVHKRVEETSQTSGAGVGLTAGLLRGFGHGFIRTVGGVYETITFPFPAPPDYRPVIQPEYVFTCECNKVPPSP